MKYVGINGNRSYLNALAGAFGLCEECEQQVKRHGDSQFRREVVCWTDNDSWETPDVPPLGVEFRILSEHPGITREELERRRNALVTNT